MHSVKIIICFVLLSSVCSTAETVALVNEKNQSLGELPSMSRGDEKLIPISLLIKKAGWTSERDGGLQMIDAPGTEVSLRRSNPFVMSNDKAVQLALKPEEWDGSFWLPVSRLSHIFNTCLWIDDVTGVISVRAVAEPDIQVQAITTAIDEPKIESNGWKLGAVILDPGHGGKDTGAKGFFDLVEKELTMDIARRTAGILRSDGVDVKLTRDGDTFLPLNSRTAFANENRGDLFVSIHANSNADPTISGVECYFLKPARTELALDAAIRENSAVEYETKTDEYQELTEQNYILLTMATSQYMKDSELWAANAVDEAEARTGLQDRGVDQAGFYVLMGAAMPAILFECGYLTNPDDAKYLSTERGRQKLAESLAASVMKMKKIMEASVVK